MNGGWGISYVIALRWMPQDLTDDKSTLVQVVVWCRQATSHYLSQCWPRSMLPNGVTRPQWVKVLSMGLAAQGWPWIWVNINSGNDLLPDSTKPWPEPMLTKHQQSLVDCVQFYRKWLKDTELVLVWKLLWFTVTSPSGQWLNSIEMAALITTRYMYQQCIQGPVSI